MGISRMTVRRLLQTPDPLRNHPPDQPRPGGLTSPSLQPYRSYLEARWKTGARLSPSSAEKWKRALHHFLAATFGRPDQPTSNVIDDQRHVALPRRQLISS